jgi:hypothetical protein
MHGGMSQSAPREIGTTPYTIAPPREDFLLGGKPAYMSEG